MTTWLIAVVIAGFIILFIKIVGRFSGYINRIIGIFLFGVFGYITVVSIIAVTAKGATSLEEIIAMLF